MVKADFTRTMLGCAGDTKANFRGDKGCAGQSNGRWDRREALQGPLWVFSRPEQSERSGEVVVPGGRPLLSHRGSSLPRSAGPYVIGPPHAMNSTRRRHCCLRSQRIVLDSFHG